MLKHLARNVWNSGGHRLGMVHQGAPSVFARDIHSGKQACEPRRFFGVEEFVDKENPKQYTYTKAKVAVAGTNSKDIKAILRSKADIPACLAVGRILAERSREADVYSAVYTPQDRDKFEGKIRAVIQSLIDNGIDIKVYLN